MAECTGAGQARRAALAAAALLAAAAAAPASAQSAAAVDATLDGLFGEHAPYAAFLAALRKAVAAGDRHAVAGMVSYPLTAHAGGHAVTVRDARQFAAQWDRIMTPAVVAAIGRQDYATLFANDEGVMIGDGQVWFAAVNGRVLITGING